MLVAQVEVPQERIHSLFPVVRTMLERVQASNACLQSGKQLADDKVHDVVALAASSGYRMGLHLCSRYHSCSQCLLTTSFQLNLSAQLYKLNLAAIPQLSCNVSTQLGCDMSAI